MSIALEEAQKAFDKGEVPIGAVVADRNGILSQAHNLIESKHDATAHAELLAIQAAAKKVSNWRLLDTVLCVTIEPCTMCLGAIRQSRIATVIYGARDARYGAMGSLYDLSQDERLGKPPQVIPGVKAEECAQLLKDFFKLRRKVKS